MAQYKYEYLVTVHDHPGLLATRLAARKRHLAKLAPRINAGQIVFGGAILAKEPVENQDPEFTGSVMLIKANSKEEVKEIILDDEYAKGLWDLSQLDIIPFRCAVRTAI
ncbi:hypothetical protein BGW36DRAFT_361317 [Talaromyces proteolyticus]|uniref:YCII-related domain-containing protein n=1 Tax=Talaromyces proteolyticus TaxID=1131652 RepID=A0AAD4KNN1_9EURO|nr:uncharacterized protein BGW36DRAFT_361317 [Talaromyces proteolyticus]KAH8695632.1 hypothetical protein BGW36DRAFT_361317 [Talaromyces proteolyticus]